MSTHNDSAELEALFDSTAVKHAATTPPAHREEAGNEAISGELYNRIGQLTRQLYDTLRQLGYDDALRQVVQKDIPGTRERLAYIANLSEQAATRTLNALERIQPVQDALENDAQKLGLRWEMLYENRLDVREFKRLAEDTQGFLLEVPDRSRKSHAQLHEIMMAQEFQDLTGQVIGKVVRLAQKMEQELLLLLVAAMPVNLKLTIENELLEGPIVNPAGRNDVAATQEQVDQLLESLGF